MIKTFAALLALFWSFSISAQPLSNDPDAPIRIGVSWACLVEEDARLFLNFPENQAEIHAKAATQDCFVSPRQFFTVLITHNVDDSVIEYGLHDWENDGVTLVRVMLPSGVPAYTLVMTDAFNVIREKVKEHDEIHNPKRPT
jgi:hypothetical protein